MHTSQRILAIEINQGNDDFLIVNTYAPNKKKDKLIFFESLLKYMDTTPVLDYNNLIVSGDFNTVLNNASDIISGAPHDKEEVETI